MTKSALIGIALLAAVLAGRAAAAQTLRDAVEGAWALDPRIKALEARREEFIARRKAAQSFFPGTPSVTLSHVTDQLIQNRRQRATEGELSTPVWLPGEGTATERVAEAELVRTDAQIALARLAAAGEVREAAYKLALAQAEANLTARRVENARALEADVVRRARAGDIAALERDLARGEVLAAQAAARDHQAQAAAARNTFLALTGLAAPPASAEEPLAADFDVARHPRLQAAERSADAARASLRLVGIATRESPEIGIVAGRNRDIFGEVYDTTVGVRVRIPFSTETRNAPRRAAANAELAAALAEQTAADREIRLQIANARQALAAAEEEVPIAEARLRALRAAAAKLANSYKAGEIGLIEVLRSRAAAFDAEAALASSRITLANARARVNQALGMVP